MKGHIPQDRTTENLMADKFSETLLSGHSESGMLVAYKGAMHQETLVDLGFLLRQNLPRSAKGKAAFTVFVEMAQSLQHHSSRVEQVGQKEVGEGFIQVSDEGGAIMVHTAFPIQPREEPAVRTLCHELAGMDSQGLRRLFRERRQSSLQPHDAALSLIAIARKAQDPLEVDFQKIDEGHPLMSLKVKVNVGGAD